MRNDLDVASLKAAKRLQALPAGRLHVVFVLKLAGQWLLFVLSGEGVKMERIDVK